MLTTSPRVKQIVSTIIQPNIALIDRDHIMALGSVLPASLTSSAIKRGSSAKKKHFLGKYRKASLHMCTMQSNPSKEIKGVSNPIMKAVPVLPHPSPMVNSVNTALAVDLGARASKGMTMANKPKQWSTKITTSSKGSLEARKVLKRIENREKAIVSSVPCQRWNVYSG